MEFYITKYFDGNAEVPIHLFLKECSEIVKHLCRNNEMLPTSNC